LYDGIEGMLRMEILMQNFFFSENKMHDNGTPPHTGSNDLGDDYEDDMVYEDEGDFDEDDMVEIVDDENDGGNLADDEDDEELDYGPGPGMEGFTGQKPNHILTSHLGTYVSQFLWSFF
jgi:hypothetical protein